MIATDITQRPDIRLTRIKFVSRITKYISIVFLMFSIAFFLFSFFTAPQSGFADNAGRALLTVFFQIVLCAWYWKLAQLFRCYQGGLIFGPAAIRCIKHLGVLFIAGWMLTSALRLFPIHHLPIVLPAGVTETATVARTYHMGFFTFDFGTGINFGPLLAGAVIILIAWIMDEGRKIQEEQALTV